MHCLNTLAGVELDTIQIKQMNLIFWYVGKCMREWDVWSKDTIWSFDLLV